MIVRVMGGLGNQLFCYAFGRSLELAHGKPIHFDLDSAYNDEQYGRRPLLSRFKKIKLSSATPGAKTHHPVFQRIALKVCFLVSKPLPKKYKFYIREPAKKQYFAELIATKFPFPVYFDGYWASYKYFESFSDRLRDELTPPAPLAVNGAPQVDWSTACFVHYRSYREERVHLRPEIWAYYRRAVDEVRARADPVKFVVFSDFREEAQKEFASRIPDVEFLFWDPGPVAASDPLFDFYYMSRCRHAITGDSTYSWWAAWLGTGSNRVVCAPDGFSPWGRDAIPNEWVAVSVLK